MAENQTEYRIAFASLLNLETANILRSRIVAALGQKDFGAHDHVL